MDVVNYKPAWAAAFVGLTLSGALAQTAAADSPPFASPVPVSVFFAPAAALPLAPVAPQLDQATALADPAPAPAIPASAPDAAVQVGTAKTAKAGTATVPSPLSVAVQDRAPAPDDAAPAVSLNAQAFDPAPYVYSDGGRSVVLGRYSTSSASAPDDLIEPINAVVALTFPRSTVHTILEAIDFTLLRSGYRFDASSASEAGGQFLDLPLPESQRQIGPYSVFTILNVLTGSAWQAQVNRINRTVSIALRPAYAMRVTAVQAVLGRVVVPAPAPASPAPTATQPAAVTEQPVTGNALAGMAFRAQTGDRP